MENALERLSRRLAEIDFEPAPAPVALPSAPLAEVHLDSFRRRLEESSEALDASAETRHRSLQGLSTLIDARLAALGAARPASSAPVAPPEPPAAPIAAPQPPFSAADFFKEVRERLLPAPEPPPAPEPLEPEPPLAAPSLPADPTPPPVAAVPAPPAPAPEAAAPAPRPWRASRGAALILAAALTIPAASWLALRPRRVPARFALNTRQAQGLSLAHGTLVSLDPERQLLVLADAATGEITAIQKFAVPGAVDVAWGDGCLWSVTNKGKILRHDASGAYDVQQSYDSGAGEGGPLSWDGSSLWLAVPGQLRKYALSPSLVLERTIAVPGLVPAGLQVAANHVWLLDNASRQALEYAVAGSDIRRLRSIDLSSPLAGSEPRGIAADAGWLWIAAAPPAVLHRLPL